MRVWNEKFIKIILKPNVDHDIIEFNYLIKKIIMSGEATWAKKARISRQKSDQSIFAQLCMGYVLAQLLYNYGKSKKERDSRHVWRHKNISKRENRRGEVGKEAPKKEMDKKRIFMTSQMTLFAVPVRNYQLHFIAWF